MIRVEHGVVINRPIEEVWAYLENLREYPRWQSGLVAMQQISDGPMGVGARIATVHQFLGRRLDLVAEVTAYEPGRRFAARVVSGPIRFRGTWNYESLEGGATRISGTLEGETDGFFRLAEPLIVRAAKRQIESDYATLKDLLEDERSASVASAGS